MKRKNAIYASRVKRKFQKPASGPNCESNTPTQNKAINKLYDMGPDGFANGISTEKYVNLCRVSRATAYRELTALCEMGLLVQTGTGRGTRYKLEDLLAGITDGNGHDGVDFGGPVGLEEF